VLFKTKTFKCNQQMQVKSEFLVKLQENTTWIQTQEK